MRESQNDDGQAEMSCSFSESNALKWNVEQSKREKNE